MVSKTIVPTKIGIEGTFYTLPTLNNQMTAYFGRLFLVPNNWWLLNIFYDIWRLHGCDEHMEWAKNFEIDWNIYGDCSLALNHASSYTLFELSKECEQNLKPSFVLPWSPQGWNLCSQETIMASWSLRGDMSQSNRNSYNEEAAKFTVKMLSYLH